MTPQPDHSSEITDEMVQRATIALMNYRRRRYGNPPMSPEEESRLLHVRRHEDDSWHRREEMRSALDAAINGST